MSSVRNKSWNGIYTRQAVKRTLCVKFTVLTREDDSKRGATIRVLKKRHAAEKKKMLEDSQYILNELLRILKPALFSYLVLCVWDTCV